MRNMIALFFFLLRIGSGVVSNAANDRSNGNHASEFILLL